MVKLMAQYNKQRIPFLDKHFICEACNLAPATQIHHRAGRGRKLLNEATWLAVCFGCHDWIHRNPSFSYVTGMMLKRV